MENEKKLIKLLNLEIKKNNDNYELYKNNIKVGYINTLLIDDKIIYITKIDIDNLHYFNKREKDNNNFNYRFYVNKSDDNLIIDINLGIEPSIIVYSNKLNIKFSITNKELILEYKDINKRGNIFENLKVKLNSNTSKERYLGNYYSYQAITNKRDKYNEYKLTALRNNQETTIIGNINQDDYISNVKETIRELIRKDSHGRSLFSRVRYLINDLLKVDDFLNVFLEERGVINDVFACFYEDLKSHDYVPVREINSEALLGIKILDSYDLRIKGFIIYDLNEVYEFGVLRGFKDDSDSYEWDDKYIYRILKNGDIASVFDLKDRVEINDKNICLELYNNYKNKKILRK